MHHLRWQGAANSNSDNLSVAFNGVDAYGLPYRTSALPSVDTYIAGSNYTYNYGPVSSINEVWAVVPSGITSIKIHWLVTGGTAVRGIYAGKDPSSAIRGQWNTNQVGTEMTFDITNFPQLCGNRIVYIRLYTDDSYFQGGIQAAWDIGGGLVGIPTSSIHGALPN